MIFRFYPWTLDIDIEATKQLYMANDYSTDKRVNTKFIQNLTGRQADFFRSIGVDPMNLNAEERVMDLSGEDNTQGNQRVCRTSIQFLICGKFVSIPDFQKELYFDDDLFGKGLPDNLEILQVPENQFPAYDLDGLGMGIIFKHPCTRFDAPEFQKWDCGYVSASLWIAEDL